MEAGVFGLVHDAHAALAQDAEKPVVRNRAVRHDDGIIATPAARRVATRHARSIATGNRQVPAHHRVPCPGGRGVIYGEPRSCFDADTDFPDIEWLRGELKAGRIKAFGEVLPQYLGMAPGDSRMEPYWALAEEFDTPVGIHMGPGPPGAAYDSSPVPMKHPNFRMGKSASTQAKCPLKSEGDIRRRCVPELERGHCR